MSYLNIMNLGQNFCCDDFWVRFSECYDTQVSITEPLWPSCFLFSVVFFFFLCVCGGGGGGGGVGGVKRL